MISIRNKKNYHWDGLRYAVRNLMSVPNVASHSNILLEI